MNIFSPTFLDQKTLTSHGPKPQVRTTFFFPEFWLPKTTTLLAIIVDLIIVFNTLNLGSLAGIDNQPCRIGHRNNFFSEMRNLCSPNDLNSHGPKELYSWDNQDLHYPKYIYIYMHIHTYIHTYTYPISIATMSQLLFASLTQFFCAFEEIHDTISSATFIWNLYKQDASLFQPLFLTFQ